MIFTLIDRCYGQFLSAFNPKHSLRQMCLRVATDGFKKQLRRKPDTTSGIFAAVVVHNMTCIHGVLTGLHRKPFVNSAIHTEARVDARHSRHVNHLFARDSPWRTVSAPLSTWMKMLHGRQETINACVLLRLRCVRTATGPILNHMDARASSACI